MTAALTPRLALDYLRELSADVRAGAVLDAAGGLLAGPVALARPAAAALAALEPAREGQARLEAGAVFVVRGGGLAIVLACGPRALPGLALHDLRLVLGDLGVSAEHVPGGSSGSGSPVDGGIGEVAELPRDVAEAVLSAA